MKVGVMKGATLLTRTPYFFATVCEDRSNPTTPCFDATYETTAVPPKNPDVEDVRTIEPLKPS